MLNHIQCNLAEQGMAVCVRIQGPSNSCLFITNHNSIMETIFQLVPIHWCHSVKSQQNTSDQGINPFRFLSLSIFRATFIHYSWHLIMICVVYGNTAWPSQDNCTNFQIIHRQKVCGDERHFFIRHLEICELLLRLPNEPTWCYPTLSITAVIINCLPPMILN